MKIGITYNYYQDIAIILYALNNANIILDDYKSCFFKIENENDIYYFSKQYDDIKHCDKKILACYIPEVFYTDLSHGHQYDKIVLTKTEDNFVDPIAKINNFLEKGNICLAANLININDINSDESLILECENHVNFLYDPVFNLIQIYYLFGYQFLNYYKFDKKDNLMGIYKQKLHIDGVERSWRDDMYNQVHSILGDDLKTYPLKEYPLREIIEPPHRTNLWQGVKMAGYTDFATSVCNIVFETCGPTQSRSYMTEKTLKSIIFCEENIFFILYGSWSTFKKLNELGFWFLNSDFCDFNNHNNEEMANSVLKATHFLKGLKEKLNSNKLVYAHLLEIYGYRLQNNIKLFYDLLNNCKNSTKILELVKK